MTSAESVRFLRSNWPMALQVGVPSLLCDKLIAEKGWSRETHTKMNRREIEERKERKGHAHTGTHRNTHRHISEQKIRWRRDSQKTSQDIHSGWTLKWHSITWKWSVLAIWSDMHVSPSEQVITSEHMPSQKACSCPGIHIAYWPFSALLVLSFSAINVPTVSLRSLPLRDKVASHKLAQRSTQRSMREIKHHHRLLRISGVFCRFKSQMLSAVYAFMRFDKDTRSRVQKWTMRLATNAMRTGECPVPEKQTMARCHSVCVCASCLCSCMFMCACVCMRIRVCAAVVTYIPQRKGVNGSQSAQLCNKRTKQRLEWNHMIAPQKW